MPGMLALALLGSTLPAAPGSDWEASASASYAAMGAFDGLGSTVSGLWTPAEFFAVGAMVDVSHLSASGTAPNGAPFSDAYLNTFVAGIVQLRLPAGRFVPHLELGAGAALWSRLEVTNTQCSYRSGFGGTVGAGLKIALVDALAVDLRGSVRPLSGGSGCNAIGNGPWSYEPGPFWSAGAGLDYRW